MGPALARKAFAEALGTLLLVATVVGSGIAAQRLSPDDVGLQLPDAHAVAGELAATDPTRPGTRRGTSSEGTP